MKWGKDMLSIDKLDELYERISKFDEFERSLVTSLTDIYSNDLEEVVGIIEDRHYVVHHNCKTMEELAWNWVVDGIIGEFEEGDFLIKFINFEKLGNHLSKSATYINIGNHMIEVIN